MLQRLFEGYDLPVLEVRGPPAGMAALLLLGGKEAVVGSWDGVSPV
jgi:hypothetical protein